jgi:anti-sigma factor RsiW
VNEFRPGESVGEGGESQPVSECRELESMFAAYADGEAASCDGDRVRKHLDSCARCRGRLAAQRVAREAVRARRSGLRACASADLRARCASFASRSPSGFRRKVLLQWAPLSVAATLLLAVAAVFSLGLNDKVQALAFQTTIDHVKCARFNAGSTPADPAGEARRWQAKFGWPIRVPASSGSLQLELRAVRRCAVTDGRVAHLMYTWMGEPLSVYVLPKVTLENASGFVRRFQHNSVVWTQNDRTYIMVTSHRRDPALDAAVAYVRANAF